MLYVLLLAGELAQLARAPHPDGKVVSKEQEEVGCRCRMVEGIEAEIEAAGFTENKALELLEAAFLVLAAPRDGASAQGSIRRRLFCTRYFCIRLQHRLKMLL